MSEVVFGWYGNVAFLVNLAKIKITKIDLIPYMHHICTLCLLTSALP